MLRKILTAVGIFLVIIVLMAASFAGGFYSSNYYRRIVLGKPASPTSMELIKEAMGLIQHSYVEEVPNIKLQRGAIKGMTEALDDPYSKYFPPSGFKTFMQHTEGHFFGVGIEIGFRDHQVTVISPISNTPADKVGIKAGDKIVAIDDKPTKGMTLEETVGKIRGDEGTKVVLTIMREGEKEPRKFTLTRERIDVPNVTSKMLDKEVGYIHLHTFNQDSGTKLRETMDDLKKKGAKGIILDLRYNPGGLLDQSIDVASLFIAKGPIVKIVSRSNKVETYNASGGADTEIPLVVLINKGSASASEIVAGALKDTKRATLVGEKTFGKGCVQEVVNLSDGSGLVITTNIYYTPKGKSINKKGVKPDVKVKMKSKKLLGKDDVQLEKAKEILKKAISKKAKKAA